MAVRQLVWDMDGTLLDSSVAVPAAYVAAVRRLGGPPVTPAQVVASYCARPAGRSSWPICSAGTLAAGEAEAYYGELAGVTGAAYPGVAAVLAGCGPRASRRGVHRRQQPRRRDAAASAGVTVDVLVGGDEVARPKPAGDGLLLTAQPARRAAPASLAYIGDAPNDLRAARAVGGARRRGRLGPPVPARTRCRPTSRSASPPAALRPTG